MTENHDLITALPSSLARCVLSNWLELKDVAHLDSGFSNTNRPQFLDLVSSIVFPIEKWSSICAHQSEYEFVSWLIARSVKVAKLDVSNVREGRVKALLEVSAKHLTSAQLTKTDNLSLIAEQCSNLGHIDFSGKELDATKLYDLLTANPNIHHLDLSCLLAPKNKKPRFVDVNCPNLRTLSVSPTDSSVRAVDNFYTQMGKFVVPLVRSIVAHSPQLRAFSFRAVYFNDISYWVDVLSSWANLRTLELHYTTFKEGSLVTIATKCPKIVHLDITGSHVCDADVEYLAQHLELRSLFIDGCNGLTTASLSSLLKYSYTTLTALSVVNTFLGSPSIMRVTMSICALLTSCKALTTLGMNNHDMRDGYMQNVTKLRVCNPFIATKDLQVIANNCVSLQYLYLEESSVRVSSIDADSVRLLLSKCTKLHTIVVKGDVVCGVINYVVAELGYRVPRIHVSRDVDDMKIGVLDMLVD